MSITRLQIEGLHLLGYTKRESEFLFLVATHSGYFTNRQFKSFAQTESGSVSHAFIRRLLERKHATYHAYRSGGRVYHVFARKVYQAIERENLRTRKKHELEYVKTRLVALDFVLAHPQHRYLETEAEKVGFFEKEYNVGRDALPVKLYRARKSAEVTPRYFVDRFPMFLNGASAPPVLTFTYVEFEFLYIAPTTRLFQPAESEFHQVLYGRREPSKCVSLLDYFRVRKAWDAKERVASADVVLLKEAQGRYARREFEELYERWRKGSAKDSDVMATAEQPFGTVKGLFRTLVFGSSLRIFTDPLGIAAESSPEPDFNHSLPQVSGSRSVQVSGSSGAK